MNTNPGTDKLLPLRSCLESHAIRRSPLSLFIASALVVGAGAFAAPMALAQDQDAQQVDSEEVDSEEAEAQPQVEQIVVTGSRIRRNEFSSASPVQIVSGELSRELGLFNVGELLQTTPQTAGTQIDNTFGGFVLDNGPGSVTIAFRGLGANRTLVMLNGRRIAPSGVGGAPAAADTSIIPAAMVERIENLFDGASTIYGSDAIAGVSNIILETDVEGFQIESSASDPQSGGADERSVSMAWGNTFDNGYVMIGAEYYNRQRQAIRDNPFINDCEGFVYETPNGDILRGNRGGLGAPQASGHLDCDIFPLTNRIQVENAFWGSLYYTPGYSNTGRGPGVTGIPNFSESTIPASTIGLLPHWVESDGNGDGVPDNFGFVDGDGDGVQDFDFQDPFYNYQRSPYALSGDFLGQSDNATLLSVAEYNFQDDNNTTIFSEVRYSRRTNSIFDPGGQIFEWVPNNNPYNPCGTNGLDCLGVIGFSAGPVRARPIINIRGDRDDNEVDVYQWSVLGGVRGDVGALSNFGQGNWGYEAYLSESYSRGKDSQTGISEARLQHSLRTSEITGTDVNGNDIITCPRYVGADAPDGLDCVPVNLFADNIFQLGGGTFTPEEAEFLFIRRAVRTEVKQRVVNAYITGDLFALPWNDAIVPIVFGAEFRRDEIISSPNDAAHDGLVWGFFADEGADGARTLREVFGEIEFSILRGLNYAEELTFSVATRWTDESYYEPATTYSARGIYRPNSWLTIRGTHGTSYRAPNLRERFLNGTTGFNTLFDPCIVPNDARDGDPLNPTAPETYNAENDERLERVLDSCMANGVDPTTFGLGGVPGAPTTTSYSVEALTGGSRELVEEQSTSSTYGFVIEQPFWEDFDLTFSATQYDVEITNSVARPGGQYIINQCYNNIDNPAGDSGFCGRVDRNPTTDRIELVDRSFINTGLETSKGIDVNIRYGQDFEVGDENLSVSFDVVGTRLQEQIFSVLDTSDDNAGETEAPHWRINTFLTFRYQEWSLSWRTRFIGGGAEDLSPNDVFEDDGIPCDGLPVACRPVYYTEDYAMHTLALGWRDGTYYVQFGVRNLLNTEPEPVDGAGVLSRSNFPIGIGYDILGRTFYLNAGAEF